MNLIQFTSINFDPIQFNSLWSNSIQGFSQALLCWGRDVTSTVNGKVDETSKLRAIGKIFQLRLRKYSSYNWGNIWVMIEEIFELWLKKYSSHNWRNIRVIIEKVFELELKQARTCRVKGRNDKTIQKELEERQKRI